VPKNEASSSSESLSTAPDVISIFCHQSGVDTRVLDDTYKRSLGRLSFLA